MSQPSTRPGSDEAGRDRYEPDWLSTQNTAGGHPAAVLAWLALMALLLGGFTLMGVAVAGDSGALFVAGLLVSGTAFLVPLALLGDAQR